MGVGDVKENLYSPRLVASRFLDGPAFGEELKAEEAVGPGRERGRGLNIEDIGVTKRGRE